MGDESIFTWCILTVGRISVQKDEPRGPALREVPSSCAPCWTVHPKSQAPRCLAHSRHSARACQGLAGWGYSVGGTLSAGDHLQAEAFLNLGFQVRRTWTPTFTPALSMRPG